MTPGRRRIRILVLAAAVAGMALVAYACTWMLWRRHVTAFSPDGNLEIGVWELPLYAETMLVVTVRPKGGIEHTVFRSTADRLPRVVEVAWASDHADLMVCDGVADPLLVRYSPSGASESDAGRAALSAVLARRYQLPPGFLAAFDGDGVRWACDSMTDVAQRYSAVIGERRVLPPVALPSEN